MAIKKLLDTALNDSDKAFTVPGAETWKVMYGHVILTSTATVGNRQILLTVTDNLGNVIYNSYAGNVQAASLAYNYSFNQGIARETTVVANSLQVPIPTDLILLPGYVLRAYDVTAVDAAADDMEVAFVVNTHNV